MVVFTCNHCGESLQKPRVEKHYSFTCRTEKFLTCVDCFKDFKGDEYNVHTKCVSEEQRYSGKDFVEKTKKGEVKQESWMEMIKSIIMHEPNMKPQYKELLNTISNYNNVPRKKAKFINFIKSSSGGRTNINDIEGVWDTIERYKMENTRVKESNSNEGNNIKSEIRANEIMKTKKKKSLPEDNDENSESKITDKSKNCLGEDDNTHLDVEKPRKEKKKRKNKDNGGIEINLEDMPSKKAKINATLESNGVGEEIQNGNNEVGTEIFRISRCISQILLKKEAISKEKLYKKVMRKFREFNRATTSDEKLQRKIDKKLKKIENVIVEDDIIKLVRK